MLHDDYVFEFEITETKKCVIPVMAKTRFIADALFDNWYGQSMEAEDKVADLLENGYQGRTITRKKPVEIGYYKTPSDIMLPKESPAPVEPRYTIHIRYADAKDSVGFYRHISIESFLNIVETANKDYILLPDEDSAKNYGMTKFIESRNEMHTDYQVVTEIYAFYYAVPKEKQHDEHGEEVHAYELDVRNDRVARPANRSI